MKKYEQIDISGDVALRVWGRTLEELFRNAAEGLSDLITDRGGIKETEEREIVITGENMEGLLVQWLNELVFLFDTYGFIGKQFSISLGHAQDDSMPGSGRRGKVRLTARISGGCFTPGVNESRLLVKAATYHGLSFRHVNSGWEAVVVFDI
ncbi:MAG: archease [Deferribacteres bacterium]|nr:archease [Deferribacteres bacterium]